MKCTRCHKNAPRILVDEVEKFVGFGHPDNVVNEHHVCEVCAQELKLPHLGYQAKLNKVWKLLNLQKHVHQIRVKAPRCPSCGMTLDELRRRGRVGCARDYTVFKDYMRELLDRMHGAHEHVGRLPGLTEGEIERMHRLSSLRSALDEAIREEDYEQAASLRDEIKHLDPGCE